MTPRKPRRPPRPLDSAALDELAIAYVGRFATTRAKLRSYLKRKLRERGWSGGSEPDLEALSERLAQRGFINDAGYAEAKARALTARGYGQRRVAQALHAAGVGEEDRGAAQRHGEQEAVGAALRFAERRRIGPFATAEPDRGQRQKAIAAMVRAGHGFDLARAVASLAPGATVDLQALDELKQRRGD